jgi:CheY-like chemotaxis protein
MKNAARVLVIEDDDRVLELVCMMLERSGYQAVGAINGIDGMDAIRRGGFDAVLTDMVMPQQGGLETIRQIRALYPQIPIVAMSGWVGSEFAPLEQAVAAGADVVLEKPFRPGDLIGVIERALRDRRDQKLS